MKIRMHSLWAKLCSQVSFTADVHMAMILGFSIKGLGQNSTPNSKGFLAKTPILMVATSTVITSTTSGPLKTESNIPSLVLLQFQL